MKKYLLILSALSLICATASYAQNSPLLIWGAGLDGSTYQLSAIYSDATNGLLLEAPLSASGAKLPITLSWRGGGNPFTINPSGTVCIGTTNPSALLTVGSSSNRGTINVIGDQIGVPAISLSDSESGGHQFTLYNGASSSGNLDFYDQTSAAYRFHINASGNIGVATTNPASLFQVDDGCTKASIGDASGIALNYGTSYLGFNASRSGSNWLTNGDGLNNGGGVIYSSIFGDMYFATVPTTGNSGQTLTDANVASKIAMRIDHNDGAVYAKQIYVQTSDWPDFVFKKSYSLRPLAEVNSYIDQNQHLPDMPTAEKVEKDGINLGEMNKALLKKVEELTLYLIEKDQEIKDQKEKNQLQSTQIIAAQNTIRQQQNAIGAIERRLQAVEQKQ